MLYDCDIEEKGLLLLCISKCLLRRTNRVKVSILLRAGYKVSKVAHLVGVSRTTVYAIKMRLDDGEGVNRRAGSCRKTSVERDSLRDAVRSSSRTPMRQHARRLGVRTVTVRRAVAKLGAKSLVIVERHETWLDSDSRPATLIKRLERCQRLVNDLKSASAGRVKIFSDEKTIGWSIL